MRTETDSPGRGGMVLLASGVATFLSAAATVTLAALAADELRYLVRDSREADATVTAQRSEAVGPGWPPGAQRDVWRTEYAFTEPDGTPRTGSDRLETGTAVRRGGTVRVRYTPGPGGRSMIVGRYDGHATRALAVSAGVFVLSASLFARSLVRRLRDHHEQELNPCVRST